MVSQTSSALGCSSIAITRDIYGHTSVEAYRFYAGGRHEIFNEAEKAVVHRDIGDWLTHILDNYPGAPLSGRESDAGLQCNGGRRRCFSHVPPSPAKTLLAKIIEYIRAIA